MKYISGEQRLTQVLTWLEKRNRTQCRFAWTTWTKPSFLAGRRRGMRGESSSRPAPPRPPARGTSPTRPCGFAWSHLWPMSRGTGRTRQATA